MKFRILNSLMPLIMCTKFQINRIILTLFSGVWDKNPTPIAEKVVGNRVNFIPLKHLFLLIIYISTCPILTQC